MSAIVEQFLAAIFGGWIDPFLLVPAALVGAAFPHERPLRVACVFAITGALTFLIVFNLSRARAIPSQEADYLVGGLFGRWLDAWLVAELAAWIRRRRADLGAGGHAMIKWFSHGHRLIAAAIVLAVLIAGWMFRFESIMGGAVHRNRFTGAVCYIHEECWFTSRY
jgi:hypothetical protein